MKHVRLRLLVASAFTLLVAACSQAPVSRDQIGAPLTPQFGSQGSDDASQIVVSKDLDAIFVTGNTAGSPLKDDAAGADNYLRRYKRDGSLWWGVQFGNSGYNLPVSLALGSGNQVYVAGYSLDLNAANNTSANGFLKHYSADGVLLWSQKVGEADTGTEVFGVATDAGGGVFVVGRTGNREFISKFSSNGDTIWTKLYGNRGFGFTEVQADRNGNLYVISDGSVRKYTNSGQLVWERKPGRTSNIIVSDLRVVGNNLYIAGYKRWGPVYSDDETDAYVAKFDLAGKLKWAKSFGTKVFDEAAAITADGQGNVYVTGFTAGTIGRKNLGKEDVIVRKFSPSGSALWIRQFGSSQYEAGLAITALTSGELYVSGVTAGNIGAGNQGSTDAFLTRLDGEGNRVWVR